MTVWSLIQELSSWGDPNSDIVINISTKNREVELEEDRKAGDIICFESAETGGEITSVGYKRNNAFVIEVEETQ